MDSLDFDYADGTTWSCLQYVTRCSHCYQSNAVMLFRGGVQQIAEAMQAKLQYGNVLMGKRVTGIAPMVSSNGVATAMQVSVSGESSPRSYSHVISTLPFGCFRMVDTSACNFSWELSTAIRALHYDSATKVAIRFKTRWWEQPGGSLAQLGGVSSTDRPTRIIVYPSYGIGQTTGATMIVSYSWSQDALRLAADIDGTGTKSNPDLLNLILNDLAVIHGLTFEAVASQVEDQHAWSWYDHENSAGM